MIKYKRIYRNLRLLKFPHLPNWLLQITLVFCLSILGSCTHSQSGQIANHPNIIRLDYAYYNPVNLVLKNQGWLEEDLQKDKIKVEWVLSQGINKALEFLKSRSIDFGSTAGAAALIGKANGNPIKSIYVYSKPEWTALVTRADSNIRSLSDVKGKRVAAKQLERTDFSNPNIGQAQKEVIISAGDVLKKSGVIESSVDVITTVN